jgi:hypothetical protein
LLRQQLYDFTHRSRLARATASARGKKNASRYVVRSSTPACGARAYSQLLLPRQQYKKRLFNPDTADDKDGGLTTSSSEQTGSQTATHLEHSEVKSNP